MDRSGYGKRRALRILVIVVTVLLAGVLASFLWMEAQAGKRRDAAYEAMEKELRPLELQKYQLREELNTLNEEYEGEVQGLASVVFLFTDVNEIIYTEIYPQMKNYGFRGVLVLAEDKLPGQAGCMTREQFDELLDAGWECCLRWNEDMDDREWQEACYSLVQMGISRPEAVYFPADTYDSEKDTILDRRGMSMAIHHGEENMALVLSKADDQIWHPGAMPWNHNNSIILLTEAMTLRGNLVFTIGSDSPEEEYDSELYAVMLDQIQKYCDSGDLMVTDLTGAREYREKMEEERGGIDEEYLNQRTELEAQIEELNRRMDEITEKYMKEWE